ncbi:hypothetical protein CFP56_024437 [Quercus suber]|uniref:Secreted protein n=1 Tax=Quercus suber TaxID=58331 RepID=A0AAW0LYG4_QUESU
MSSELFSLPPALFSLCSSAFFFFILKACPAITAGIAAPNRDHHTSTITKAEAKSEPEPYLNPTPSLTT